MSRSECNIRLNVSYGPRLYFQTLSVAQGYARSLGERGYLDVRVRPFRTGWQVQTIGIRVNW